MQGVTCHTAPQGAGEEEELGGHLAEPCELAEEGVGYWGRQWDQWVEPAVGRWSLDLASLHDLQGLRYCKTKKKQNKFQSKLILKNKI